MYLEVLYIVLAGSKALLWNVLFLAGYDVQRPGSDGTGEL